jgi:GGDEF domain-containing protein
MRFPAAPRSTLEALVSPDGQTRAEGLLELLPIAAAVAWMDGERLVIDQPNALFQQLGADREPASARLTRDLGGRIATFLAGRALREQLPWRTGGAVEQRHFDVLLARIPGAGRARCLATLIDQTGEMRTESNLRREMTTDSLTGLPNRAGFGDRLEARIAAGMKNYAVLVVDLDRFGRVNSCLGSMAADEMLITVARRIKRSLRAGDDFGRIGGDEFGVVIALDHDRARPTASRRGSARCCRRRSG